MRVRIIPFLIAGAFAAVLAGCAHTGAKAHTLHVDSTAKVQGKVGEVMTFGLPGNAGTGYTWNQVTTPPSFLQEIGKPTFVADHADMPGSSGETRFEFKAMSAGEGTLRFEYSRSWEKNVPPARWAKVEVTVTR